MPPNFMDIADELRERALSRTSQTLGKLEGLRNTHGLPIEHLPLVIDLYSKSVEALLAEEARADLDAHTRRLPLTLRSEYASRPVKILPMQSAQISESPQVASFRPEEFRIHGDPTHWVVHDIKVANRTQFLGKHRSIPGTEFSPGGICSPLRLATVYQGSQLLLVVEYVGPDESGEVFEATIVGTAVEFPRTEPS